MNDVLDRLAADAFRSRFRLREKERAIIRSRGMPVILSHAHDFVAKRLAPANPPNDGRQTPWRGHPVFVAQHATATCCRRCLETWHGIERGRGLTPAEETRVLALIEDWLVSALRQREASHP